LAVGTLREEDARHSTSSNLADDAVRTDVSPYFVPAETRYFGNHGRRDRRGRRLEKARHIIDTGEQRLDLAAEIGLAGACGVQHRRSAIRLAFKRGIEQLADALPAIRVEIRGHR